ncbi:MAG: peptidase S41 [Verrucomicrobia bacterium]|mgnify:CR=1 FL=1|nr:peptidase S41 [Verrucomicrobiota bacterium]
MKKASNPFIYLPLILAISLAVGVYLGRQMVIGTSTQLGFEANDYDEGDKLKQVINFIKSDYVDTVQEQIIVENTINEILQNLDPHSYYIPKRQYNQMNDPLEGNFDGIGIEFRIQEDTVIVVRAIGGGPSEKLGIQSGDRIIQVNDENITGSKISNQKVVKLLKGPKGTEVSIKVRRNGHDELIDFKITRDKIPLHSVDATFMLDAEVGYIKVIRFARTTYDEFVDAIALLEDKGMKKLVLDLRNNSGGYMKSAIDMADEFLEKDKLVVYTKGKARDRKSFYATSRGQLENLSVAILINEGSASASEILAGALQDNDRGVIIGRRSFGKGLVQEGVQWPDGSAIRLTVARYYTPTGRSIQKPYDNGLDAYNQEAFDRYLNGELINTDSIDFPDSLKFYTEKGKLLFGGGGIMPDVFVPLDTQDISAYFMRLNMQSLFYNFGFMYADQNRDQLEEKYTAEAFVETFRIDHSLLGDFYEFATSKGVEYNSKGAEKSKHIIQNRIKAAVGRNLWGDNVFYEIINKDDILIQRTLEELTPSQLSLN